MAAALFEAGMGELAIRVLYSPDPIDYVLATATLGRVAAMRRAAAAELERSDED
jgi:hypothetical protein